LACVRAGGSLSLVPIECRIHRNCCGDTVLDSDRAFPRPAGLTEGDADPAGAPVNEPWETAQERPAAVAMLGNDKHGNEGNCDTRAVLS